MPKTFFITTAIDYTNSPPHVGHAYEKVLADVIARYQRLKGEKVFFLTGVDQHGQKVQQSAAKAGIPPAEFVKEITQKFVDLWEKLNISYDRPSGWAATTSEGHKGVVQGILQRLWDEKDLTTGESRWIYKAKQAGHYSVRQEQFVTDKERGPDGQFGPEWGQVEFREEENYYFRLSDHKQWLLDLIDKRATEGKPLVIPPFRQLELRNAVEKIAGDLCISRPKSRLNWGIELPFDKDFVNYVWFDALANYISFAGYDPKINSYDRQSQQFRDRWPALQIIGKDILVPAHGIYWLMMLHAIGFPDNQMPQLLVHGWWNLGGAKMSKSAGNIVDPFLLIDKYGADALRYYLISDIETGYDSNFEADRFTNLYNNDLANSLGNLLNRTLSMTNQYRQGRLDRSFEKHPAFLQDDSLWSSVHLAIQMRTIPDFVRIVYSEFPAALNQFEIHYHVGRVNHLNKLCNELVEIAAPWKLAKNPTRAWELSAVLYYLAESLRVVSVFMSIVIPKAAHGIFDQLNWKMELSGKEERFSLADAEWGRLPDGHVVGKPVPLFPRIEQ